MIRGGVSPVERTFHHGAVLRIRSVRRGNFIIDDNVILVLNRRHLIRGASILRNGIGLDRNDAVRALPPRIIHQRNFKIIIGIRPILETDEKLLKFHRSAFARRDLKFEKQIVFCVVGDIDRFFIIDPFRVFRLHQHPVPALFYIRGRILIYFHAYAAFRRKQGIDRYKFARILRLLIFRRGHAVRFRNSGRGGGKLFFRFRKG